MTLSSNNAQTRELGELRNHLKWLDEERRKSARKMAELEQRLAQQGREVAERDQKIQELEWHVANFAERLDRVPESDPTTAAQEQRLQDLEWHLSNISTQLTRLPNPDEEHARLQTAISEAVLEAQQRVMADVSSLRESESRLALQFHALEETLSAGQGIEEQLLPLAEQQQADRQVLAGLREELAALREGIDQMSVDLRDRTVTLAAESQTNLTALATRFQEHLDALVRDQQGQYESLNQQLEMRTAMLAGEFQDNLNAVASRAPDISPEFIRVNEQVTELEQQVAAMEAFFAPLSGKQADLEAAIEYLPSMTVRLAEIEQRVTEVDEMLSPLSGGQSTLREAVESLPSLTAKLAQLAQRTTEIDEVLASWSERQGAVQAALEQLPGIDGQVARLEETVAKLGNVREMIPMLNRLEQEMELRQAEEVRLSNLLATQEGRFVPLNTGIDEMREANLVVMSRLSESERLVEELRRSAQDFNDNWKPIFTEVNRRIGPLTERMTALNNNVLKAEASLVALNGDQAEMRETVVNLSEDVHRSRTEIGRQMDAWQTTLDEHKDTIERFTQQWLTLSNQYKEARMAVQNFAHWQKQLEQQKREASEMLRVETNRMQGRWEGFLLEIQEKLKNFELELGQKWQAFELENEQKWSGARRSEQLWREELGAIDELIQKLQQDNRNLIWRVQAAQADAIKKWPRLLMEEVEKAVELNPNRRLSSTSAAARTEMSVVDAIEQGLIKIDYNDESAIDL